MLRSCSPRDRQSVSQSVSQSANRLGARQQLFFTVLLITPNSNWASHGPNKEAPKKPDEPTAEAAYLPTNYSKTPPPAIDFSALASFFSPFSMSSAKQSKATKNSNESSHPPPLPSSLRVFIRSSPSKSRKKK